MKPKLASTKYIDDIVWVKETDTIRMCHNLLEQHGLFLGGSSGTVLQGLYQYSPHILPGSTLIAISPDNGERYLDTVYNNDWIADKFGSLSTEKNNAK